ncbi:phosphotransferase [Kineococcus sp. NPDC059986]|uniref:phosphotransferase family protein n=1 Tax=Kineococcus sp. NPDC059986 TaxID=3155538 RepID=UPI00345096F4
MTLLDHATAERLCSTALGQPVQVDHLRRLRGGTKKGVFRVGTTDGRSVVLYVWHPEEDWWHGSQDPAADVEPFTAANGLHLLTGAHAVLTAVGVRVPRVLSTEEGGRSGVPDTAVVEDVPGASLADLLDSDRVATGVLADLRGHLHRLAATRNPRWGKVGRPGVGPDAQPQVPFHEVVLTRAERHLQAAAAREARLDRVTGSVGAALRDRAAAVRPRDQAGYGLVHGELGPDHVLLDREHRPVLVDLEGVMWADVEWEHAFLALRFGDHYEALRLPGLDPARLGLYRLALHLSLVEGPLRLIDQGLANSGFMAEIAEHNLHEVLAAVSG